jgi:hypothetical protein
MCSKSTTFAFATLIAQVEGFATVGNVSNLLVLVVPVLAIARLLPIFAFREAVCTLCIKTKDNNAQVLLMHPKRHTEAFCVSQALCAHRARAKQRQTTSVRRTKIAFQASVWAVTALDTPANQARLVATTVLANKGQYAQSKVYARAKKAPCARQTLTACPASLAKKKCAKLRPRAAFAAKTAIAQVASACKAMYLRWALATCNG